MDTPGYSATSYADQSRGGSSLVWSDPANASIGSPVTTGSGFTPGLSSHWLSGMGFVPMPSIPTGATVTGLRAYVRHRATSLGVATGVSLSAANSGALNLSPNHAVPSTFEDYLIDLAGLLPLTPAQLNAGLPFRVAYDAFGTSDPYDPAKWDVSISPSSPDATFGPAPRSRTTAWTITATWTGGGAAPSFVLLSIRSRAIIDGARGGGEPGSTGTISLDNGLGGTLNESFSGVEGSGYREVDTTVKRMVAVSGGVGGTTVTSNASVTTTYYSNQAGARNALTSEVTQPDPTTVEVESMYLVASYEGAPPPPPSSVQPLPPNLSRIPSLTPLTPTIR